jgi:hypothetical protein
MHLCELIHISSYILLYIWMLAALIMIEVVILFHTFVRNKHILRAP